MTEFGPAEAEGLVVRTLDGGPPSVVKLVRRGFVPLADEAWARGRPRDRLAQPSAA